MWLEVVFCKVIFFICRQSTEVYFGLVWASIYIYIYIVIIEGVCLPTVCFLVACYIGQPFFRDFGKKLYIYI